MAANDLANLSDEAALENPGAIAEGEEGDGGASFVLSIGRGDEVKEALGGAPVGRVYFGYADGDNRPVISTWDDRGKTWSQPLDVGAAFGINNVAFPAVVAVMTIARRSPSMARRRRADCRDQSLPACGSAHL